MEIHRNRTFKSYIIVRQSRKFSEHESNDYEFVTEVADGNAAKDAVESLAESDDEHRYIAFKKEYQLERFTWANGHSFKEAKEYKEFLERNP
jgi:hypothetical protein